MTEKIFKRLPYGVFNFETIRTKNYAYVGKMRFFDLLENESKRYHMLICPRKFGKNKQKI